MFLSSVMESVPLFAMVYENDKSAACALSTAVNVLILVRVTI